MKKCICLCVFVSFSLILCAAELSVSMDDVRIERDGTAGYHLYIRKKDGIRSVLLTETTRDPEGRADNYAFRALEWNPVNGDELRLLDGQFLVSDQARYSLIDSTPEDDPVFGRAFHIYIPPIMEYGYPWTRNGTESLGKGVFLNIRAFEKPYGDYTGEFADNPFVVDLVPRHVAEPSAAEPVLLDDFRPETVESFSDIARQGAGKILYSRGVEDITDKIRDVLVPADPGRQLDIVFAIDATYSMQDDIAALRKTVLPMLEESLPGYKSFRLGLVLYKDYGDDFWYRSLPVKVFPFTSDLKEFERSLNGFRASGGRDIPEAVYEALYASMEFYPWDPDALRKVILIGDAEPHPVPRGTKKYTKELADDLVREKEVEMNVIILLDSSRPN